MKNMNVNRNHNSWVNRHLRKISIRVSVLMLIILGIAGLELVQAQATEPIRPPKPILKAVAGDGQVLLYWDDNAESHFDEYLQSIGRNPNNFEGYMVYKSTDPNFVDALRITDNFGNKTRLAPEVQFDLANEITGYHPAAINGTRFFLGNDIGLRRVWVDNNVMNGRTYYYAVVAYTHGDAVAGFPLPFDPSGTPFPNEIYVHPPLESEIDISITSNGTVITGDNTVKVIPRRPSVGYVEPMNPTVSRVSGSAGGTITVDIIDPAELIAGSNYSITFQDTIIPGAPGRPDLPVTKNFSLFNNITGEFVFEEVADFRSLPLPIKEGFQLTIQAAGDTVRANMELSAWESNQPDPIHSFLFDISTRFPQLADYRIEFGEGAVARSQQYTLTVGGSSVVFPEQDVNFRVFSETSGEEIPFAFAANVPRGLRDNQYLTSQTGFNAGVGGVVQRTTDGGDTWETLITGTQNDLNTIFFINENVGFAAGFEGTIIKTTDGGDLWEIVDTGFTNEIFSMTFINDDIGYIIGSGGLIARTSDGGDNWTQIPTGFIQDLRAIFFASEDVGYIGGLNRVLKTTDGGLSWTGITTGVSFFTVNDIHFFDENRGVLVGNTGRIFRTDDGGDTWNNFQVGTTAQASLLGVTFMDDNIGFAVGNNGRYITTVNGGDNWTVQTPLSTTNLFSIASGFTDRIWVIGANNTRLRSSDTGTSFTLSERINRFRALIDRTGNARSDAIYFIEDFGTNTDVDTWVVSMLPDLRGTSVDPADGDILNLVTIKPFTSADEFTFTIGDENVASVDQDQLAGALDNVRVVPNPYLVTHLAEQGSNNGARERQLHFTNLPAQCTIRIFSVSGRILQTLNVNNSLDNDRYIWNMRTSDNSDLPYGVYIYHVSAPGVGEKVGKFAVIK